MIHGPAMLHKRRKLLLILVAALVVLVTAYAVFGYHFAPKLLRKQATAWVQEQYGRELKLGEIRIDPFRLKLEIHDLALPDDDGQALVGAGRFMVDFQASSLFRRAWTFRAIELDQPEVRAVVRQDGRLNLVDLAHLRNPPPPDPDAGIPRLWVQLLQVTGGNVEYLVAARAEPLVKRISPIEFSLRDFRTTAEGGQFVLTASSTGDERFDWRGRFALEPQVVSEGDIGIGGLRVASLLDLMPEPPPVAVGSGVIDLNAHYRVSLGEEVELALQSPAISVSQLSLGKAGETDWLAAAAIALENIDFDLASRRVHAARLHLDALKARSWLDPQGRMNLAELFATPGAAPQGAGTSPAGGAAAPAAPAPASTGPQAEWTASVDAVQITGADIDFEDRSLEERPHFRITPLNLTTGALSLDLAKPVTLQLDARINDAAQLQVEGALAPAPLAGKLKIDLRDASLALVQPYILPVADLTIRSGTVSTRGELGMAPAKAGPDTVIGFDGDISLENLHSVDNTLREDLLNMRRLQVQKLRYRSAPASLTIQRIQVQEPYARVVISREQVVNISAVFDPESAAAKMEEFRAAQASGGKAAPQRKESRSERRRREKAEKEEKKSKAAAAAAALAQPEPPETFPIRIGEVRVQKGRMNFADFNIQPNFAAEILDLTGTIKGMSSARSSRAEVDLKGNLGEFSPVTISGTIQPFAFDRFTDISLKFENIALPVFNPYSGVFAGYNIAKGALTTDLNYQIDNRKLEAKHHIRIEQLEWGEASQFKGEATLPVKFATALLRDRHGVINLDVPVSGSLDDPTLRIGPLVWQVIKNLLTKVVTAPFSWLGSLFAGAEEAQFIDFAPGEATLDPMAAGRLAQLAKGLAEKPDISVDIPLAAIAQVDRPALVQLRLQSQLEEAAAGPPAKGVAAKDGGQAPGVPGYTSLTAKQKRDALSAWYRLQKRALPTIPEPAAPPEGTSKAEAREQVDQAAVAVIEQDLKDRITVEDAELEQLAQARAAAVQSALLSGGELEASRVFIVRADQVSMQGESVRLKLELK